MRASTALRCVIRSATRPKCLPIHSITLLLLWGRKLYEAAESVDEPHLLDRARLKVQQLWTTDEHRETASTRHGDVQTVAAVEEVHVALHLRGVPPSRTPRNPARGDDRNRTGAVA
jgi:hypothetical protein